MRSPQLPILAGRLSIPLLERALDIFLVRHHDVEFCSFLHQPTVTAEWLASERLFLSQSLIALSALYMTEQEAHEAGYSSVKSLSEEFTEVARLSSRKSIDEPSGMS